MYRKNLRHVEGLRQQVTLAIGACYVRLLAIDSFYANTGCVYNPHRDAARDCRRKKKDYIKCLETRVTVLENQNKCLITELKSLKELYCQQDS